MKPAGGSDTQHVLQCMDLWSGIVRDDPCRLARPVKKIPSLELVNNNRKTPATSCGR